MKVNSTINELSLARRASEKPLLGEAVGAGSAGTRRWGWRGDADPSAGSVLGGQCWNRVRGWARPGELSQEMEPERGLGTELQPRCKVHAGDRTRNKATIWT